MTNFRICTKLTVETRADGNVEVPQSVAERDSLKIAEECISVERIDSNRDVVTTVAAALDCEHPINAVQALQYLETHVGILPVPVYLNRKFISDNTIKSRFSIVSRSFAQLGSRVLNDNLRGGSFDVYADSNGQILIYVSNFSVGGNAIEDSIALAQVDGKLMGLRSYFGLATIPAISNYEFGDFANLLLIQPTTEHEALSRESLVPKEFLYVLKS